ncbi:hypothetical protein R1flu_003022 [Riccia fluitans]|uniref:G-patch domain-containing protein n=1 Tax=Riccia fluitans TaxID=41844 RepID=A0ABD1YB86_9MARC
MAEEEDDYLADLTRFIPSEFASTPSVKSKKSSPERDVRRGKGKRKEQQKIAEDELRKEGFGAAIPSSNIGFKMLQQMGYTPGAALGKHGQGVLEPVNVDLKRSRTGLGRDEVVKQEEVLKAKRAELESIRQKQVETEQRADFQERRKSSWQTRKIASQYVKATSTIADLEERYNIPADARTQSVTTSEKEESEAAEVKQEEEEEEEITFEMLQDILGKLRNGFNYCFFCGVQYESAEALEAGCPGLDEEDH